MSCHVMSVGLSGGGRGEVFAQVRGRSVDGFDVEARVVEDVPSIAFVHSIDLSLLNRSLDRGVRRDVYGQTLLGERLETLARLLC